MGQFKTYGQGNNNTGSAFDQLFNPAGLTPYRPKINPLNSLYKDPPNLWKPGSPAAGDVSSINRILPGLGISISDANLLGAFLFDTKTAVPLDVDHISQLYRHVIVSNALQLSITSYLGLLTLSPAAVPASPTLAELDQIVATAQWISKAGLNVYQVDYFSNADQDPGVYITPLYSDSDITTWRQTLNNTIQYPEIPAGISPEALKAILDKLDSEIFSQVAALFGADAQLVASVMPLAIATPGKGSTWENLFLNDVAYCSTTLKLASRWVMFAQSLKLSTALINNVIASPLIYNISGKFGITPSLATMQSIWQVNTIMQTYGDLKQNLLQALDMLPSPPWTAPTSNLDEILTLLNEATGWNIDDIKSLLVTFTVTSLDQVSSLLASMQTCFNLMSAIGADTGFMNALAEIFTLPGGTGPNWETYKALEASAQGKIAGLYGSQWATVSTAMLGNLALNQKDAVLALVMAQLNAMDSSITSSRNVYEYLLTNVNTGSAAQTSYIVEATAAAQLYLQRCRLMLEPGVIDLSGIDATWWEWMLNYRVWEANREIFVYPENYLIPNLRQSATPQFTTLSQALQQINISPSSSDSAFLTAVNNSGQNAAAEAAYTSYINDFSDVTKTTVIDSHFATVNNTGTTFLLGRSLSSPYTFYYCYQPDGLPWTSWEKLDITIKSTNGSLVYAFNRLFIFWTEIHQNNTSSVSATGTSQQIQTNYITSATVSVMYSFLNIDGKWVQPQTLVDNATVFYDTSNPPPGPTTSDTLFNGLFDVNNNPYWNKVCALRIMGKDNYGTQPINPMQPEKLIVIWGPNINITGGWIKTSRLHLLHNLLL